MPELEPITREEKFLNGEVGMTPITREEKILAGEDIETVTRREYFLKKYRGGGGGDVTVVPLSVTDNGTYSEEGKAYSPVSVNVPLPENTYLLKSVNTPTPIASFNDGEEMVMSSLKVAIEPQQDLHGYDSPWAGGAGKNKFNPSSILQGTYNNTTNVWSVDIATIAKAIDMTFKENTQYTFSGKAKQGVANKNLRLQIIYTDSTVTNLWASNTTDELPFNVTSTSGKSISSINFNFGNSGGTVEITDLQIELGSTATSYAPYSNICPISGWDEVDVNVSGVNVWDEEWESGYYFTNSSGKIAKGSNNVTIRSKNPRYIPPNTTCRVVGSVYRYFFVDKDNNVVSQMTNSVFTTPSSGIYLYFYCEGISTYNNDISINYPSTDTSYHAYTGTTYTIDLDGTRYGGELDVVNGIVTPAPYYASYNGEELTGEWISDRDKYEVGATPTIGAQVVNIGASGIPVSILPTAVKSLRGVNNVWADTGDITDAEYFSKEV